MDISIPGVSATGTSPNLDTATVAQGISTSARFDGTDTREAAISKPYGDTYGWILHPQPPEQDGKPLWGSFPQWLAEGSSTVYWVTGKPGSGKSTMLKFLLQQLLLRSHLSRGLGNLRLLIVRYYAWNAGTTLHQSSEGLKRTVMSQALDLYPELTLKLAPRRWFLCQVLRTASSLPHWDTWEVERAFKALLSQCGKTIKLVLFIDGLGEFDTPPKDVVHQIREMTALCPTRLKICVASRPCNAFNDEYGQGPVLKMHLVTHDGMINFVAGIFQENKAWAEHLALNPQATSQLISDIATKANGVFQWVSLVRLLLDLLTDGESPTQAVDIQQVLQDLPSELGALYEKIWARVQPNKLPMGSFMMRIMRAVRGPVSFLTMWLVKSLKQCSVQVEPYSTELPPRYIDEFQTNTNAKILLKLQWKRQLVDCTKGILELNSEGNGFVDFIHRTAREWASNPETWGRICNASQETFDTHVYLLEADTLTLSYRSPTCNGCFWHASKVSFTPQNTKKVIKCLNSLGEACRELGGEDRWKKRSCWAPARFDADNTFAGLAAQFSILPYIEWALLSGHIRPHKKPSQGSLGLLENAIFGPLYYNPPVVPLGSGEHPIPRDQRLATVKYLLKHGFYQSEVHTWSGVRDLKDELQNTPSTDPEYEYYAAVVACLDDMTKMAQMKATFTSASECLRSRVGYLFGRD
ncbi:hypothetical protein B0J15DRAFT_513590 [Fusarium solani]|uniref:Nephrocystin 3-like N-terminal domain-containing protein n=1 Tax=Fusarium solani TaxID=169388 RepID=A0A9P9HA63_FUSSL|nr:uncharacterized protein B0J15DRAFT_513590 [Fusarium solani]KAH7253370.1 hypothetical protein B0J15DRAFT_513590 [Fusarium solani]